MTTTTGNQKMREMKSFKMNRSSVLGMIIIGAFLAFEVFNFSTTDFALRDVLGDLKFLGLRWSTMLAIAFCAIDFAGIAKMFTPDENKGMVKETWFLFGAWVLAAGMNATLTWWGVSVALVNNGTVGASVISQEVMVRVVPIFVAVMVWLIRVLVIGSLSLSVNALTGVSEGKTLLQRFGLDKINFKKRQTNKNGSEKQPYRSPMPTPTNRSTNRTTPMRANSDSQNRSVHF